jgi:hypothetical protein
MKMPSGIYAHKLEELIARRFSPEGREERIARAVQSLREFCDSFEGLDLETIKWIAQADLFDED